MFLPESNLKEVLLPDVALFDASALIKTACDGSIIWSNCILPFTILKSNVSWL